MKKKLILTLMVTVLFCVASVITAAVVFASSTQNENKTNLYYAPEITIDYENYSVDSIPLAIKGVKYKIFDAYAEDVYGNELAVNAKVFIHYLEPNKSLINLEDGYAMPKHYGIYTVEYSAIDEFGNKGYASYEFTCAQVEQLSLSLYGNFDSSVQVGKEAKIKSFSYANGIGNVAVKVFASNDNGISYDITGKTTFIPLYIGNYTITYECKDYNLTAKQSYSLNVTENNTSIIYDEPTLPKYFIVGKEYTLPDAICYNFDSGVPTLVNPSIYVKYGNGAYTSVNGNKFTATAEGNITFKYSVTGDYKEYTCKAINVGFTNNTLDMRKYFYSNTAESEATEDAILFVANADGEKIEFINAIESNRFDFIFSIPNGYSNFEKINFFLINSVDESKSLKITYAKLQEKSSISINDGKKIKCDEIFSSDSPISVNYKEKTKTLRFGTALTLDLSAFDGFNGEKVYFSFSLEGITGQSGINVIKIANQVFSNDISDGFAPQVYFETYPNGYESIGNKVTIDRIFVFDVLDPSYEISYCVVAPSGDYVIDVNNVILNAQNADYQKSYSFVAMEYGRYTVDFVVRDSAGNEEEYGYAIVVEDLEGPTVSFISTMANKLKIGEGCKISELAISDNKSTKFKSFAYIIKPNLQSASVDIGEIYTFDKFGKYVLCYVVQDLSGNTTILTHTFVVS